MIAAAPFDRIPRRAPGVERLLNGYPVAANPQKQFPVNHGHDS
jgi:hypothetical protein